MASRSKNKPYKRVLPNLKISIDNTSDNEDSSSSDSEEGEIRESFIVPVETITENYVEKPKFKMKEPHVSRKIPSPILSDDFFGGIEDLETFSVDKVM